MDHTVNGDGGNDQLALLTQICRTDIAPYALEVDRSGRFPTEAIDALRRGGFLTLGIGKDYDGMGGEFGGDYLLAYRALEEIAKSCTSAAQIFAVHMASCAQIAALGTEEQKRRLLGGVTAEGELWGACANELGLVAPGSRPVAHKIDGGYVVDSKECFSTSSTGAARFLLWAAEQDGDPIHNLFVMAVARDTPGVEIIVDLEGMGQRGAGCGTTRFSKVFVPMRDVIGGEVNAFYRAPAALGPMFQLGFAVICLGAAEGAFSEACGYLVSRRSLLRAVSRIAEDPIVQLKVGDTESRLAAARLLAYDAARRLEAVERDPDRRVEAALAVYKAKVFTTEVALAATHDAFGWCGTSATLAGNKFEMFWRNIRTLTLHAPVDRRREAIGQAVLGIANPSIAAL